METENLTPFPAVAWETVDADRRWHLTTLLRVKYVFQAGERPGDWTLRLTPDQGELFGADVFFDDDMTRPLRHESDFTPYKPNTDLIVNAVARTRTPKTHWQCGLQVLGPRDATGRRPTLKRVALKLSGERRWEKRPPLGWVEGELRAVREIPVRYDRAYGGAIVNPEAGGDAGGDHDNSRATPPFLAYHAQNPAGTGLTHRRMAADAYLAPQIHWADKALARAGHPAGLGAIHRSWQPRLALAGCYDQAWLDHQHPYPPKDFDDRHHQAANPALILDGYLPQGSALALANLMGADRIDRFHLPELHAFADLEARGEIRRLHLPIDTVLIDIDAPDPADWAVYLSYRTRIPRPASIDVLRFRYLPSEQLARQRAEARSGETHPPPPRHAAETTTEKTTESPHG